MAAAEEGRSSAEAAAATAPSAVSTVNNNNIDDDDEIDYFLNPAPRFTAAQPKSATSVLFSPLTAASVASSADVSTVSTPTPPESTPPPPLPSSPPPPPTLATTMHQFPLSVVAGGKGIRA